jgi:periplasmic protein CpxP/Spy
MSKNIFVLFAFILTASFAQAQSAQVAENPTERAHTQALGLQKQLGLTEEQTAKAEAIYLARHNEVEAIKNDATKSQEQKDNAITIVRKEKEKEIQALLTPEQLIKYNELKTVRQNRKNAANDE